ncbi:MAG: hypothetical protein ACO1OF_10120 [Adhaeribacter sp.]
MIADNPFILYSLPQSRTTQQLFHGRNIKNTWENICKFLINCTTVQPNQPLGLCLTAYSANKDDSNPEIADKIIAEAKSIFGDAKSEPISYSYPEGLPNEVTKTDWNLDSSDLERVVKYLVNGQPWPKFTYGPIELTLSYNFKLVDPITKKELANQELSSSLMVWLSRSCLCSPDIYFPFSQPNAEFYNFLRGLEVFLPFKLEQKYLRLGRPNKNKTAHVFNKILK